MGFVLFSVRVLWEDFLSALTKNPDYELLFGGNIKQLQTVLQPAVHQEAAAAF